jgi:dihydrolipoamide dehydrogenase
LAGPGKVAVDGDQPQELTAKNVIIASGSKPMMIPGIEFDGKHVGTSTEALNYDKVPEHLVIIGGGVIGLELGSVWKRLGAKVTVLEFLDRIMAGMDTELARDAQKIYEKQGIEFRLKTRVTSAKYDGSKCVVTIDGGEPIHCDKVLVSVGRVPCTEGLGLETVGLQLDAKKRIPVDKHLRTPVSGIYAIGDCIERPDARAQGRRRGRGRRGVHRHRLRARQLRRDTERRLHGARGRIRRQDRRRTQGGRRRVSQRLVPVQLPRPG